MKRLLAVCVIAVTLLSLCACGKGKDDGKGTTTTTITTTTQSRPMEAPTNVEEVATTFVRAYYLRDYATRFSMMFYDARKQWEDNAIKQEGSEEAFCATVQQQANDKGIDVDIHSFDDYYAHYHQFILNDISNMYGEYQVVTTVSESKRMAGDELNQFRDKQLGALDPKYVDAEAFHAVTEAYTVTVNIVIDGTKKDYNEFYNVYLVLHNGQWLVVEHTI